jgi:uncharacterized protein YraI
MRSGTRSIGAGTRSIASAALAGIAIAILPPTATPAAAEPAVVSATSLNLRAGPGGAERVLARMPQGARVTVSNCGPEWCRIRYRGLNGYAAIDHLDLSSGGDAQASVPPADNETTTGYRVWNDPAPERAARVWRWQDPQWRDRHARKVQWLRRHQRR